MNRGLSLIFVAASLIVLAGCGTSGPVLVSLGERAATASMSPDTTTAQITLGPWEYVTYRISMPASFAGDMVWFEAVTGDGSPQPLLLLDDGDQTFRSNSDRGFTLVDASILEPSQQDFQTTAVDVNKQCLGPCIAVGSILDPEILQVQNRSSGTISVDVYVYDDVIQDLNEPNNNSTGFAPTLSFGEDVDSGAIELIGDRDYYYIPAGGDFEFSVPSGAPIVAEIVAADGMTVVDSAGPNERVQVLSDEYVRLKAVNDAYAGPPNGNASLYYVSLY